MATGFIKDLRLIEEDCKVDDLLDFSKEIKSFSKKLDTIEGSAIIGLVGKFGCGKSTMLYQVQKEREKTELWVNFDAWKYPDRRDLWEGFVLDFAEQIGNKKKVQKKIEGKSNFDSSLEFVKGIASFVPYLDNIKGFINIFKSSPATRVFEIQAIMKEMIDKSEKDIYIVIEDIDRSGDAGIYFLETLKQFIRSCAQDNKVVAIVPIGDENYEGKLRESYLKCLDYKEDFMPKFGGLEKFVDTIFDAEIFADNWAIPKSGRKSTGPNRKSLLISFLERLVIDSINIRELKAILRKANIAYIRQTNDGLLPEFRLNILVESAKYIPSGIEKKEFYYELFTSKLRIPANSIFATCIFCMYNDRDSLYEGHDQDGNKVQRKSKLDCRFVPVADPDALGAPLVPWYPNDPFEKENWYIVPDFYLDY